jgi:LysR family pca operon transcriptional activator
LRTSLLASGPFITAFPGSALRLNTSASHLTILPVALPVRPWPVAVVTLKNRTLTPASERFIDHLRSHATTRRP